MNNSEAQPANWLQPDSSEWLNGIEVTVSEQLLATARNYVEAVNSNQEIDTHNLENLVLASIAKYGIAKLRRDERPDFHGWLPVARQACYDVELPELAQKHSADRADSLFAGDPAITRMLERHAYGSCKPPEKGESKDIPDAVVMACALITKDL